MNIRKLSSLTCAFLAVTLFLVAVAGAAENLDGAWVRVWPESETPGAMPVKILCGDRFAFGWQSADGTEAFAGGGTYKLVGTTYMETIVYHFMPELVGHTIPFTCKIEDGQWHHSAQFTVDGVQFDINEIWVRVEDLRGGE